MLVSLPHLASQTEKYWDFYLLVVIQDQMKLEIRQSWGGSGVEWREGSIRHPANSQTAYFQCRLYHSSVWDLEQVPTPQLPHLQNEAKICNYPDRIAMRIK